MSLPRYKKDWAIWAAKQGFHVFPIAEDTKVPIRGIKFKEMSTTDLQQIESWWSENSEYNIGIYTGKFGPEGKEALVAVDVDAKEGSNGFDTLNELELKGIADTSTFHQATPSGGAHFVYRSAFGVRPSVRKLGPGIDIRSWGSYIVGPGSTLQGKTYSFRGGDLLHVSEGLLKECSGPVNEPETRQDASPPIPINRESNVKRAREWFRGWTCRNFEGNVHQGRREVTAYKVAVGIGDFGLTGSDICALLEEWNALYCTPPLETRELHLAARSAERYRQNSVGVKTPEAMFPAIEEPDLKSFDIDSEIAQDKKADGTELEAYFKEINKEYAFIMDGSHVIQETNDFDGLKVVKHFSVNDFHLNLAPLKVKIQKEDKAPKLESVSRMWIASPKRRQYKGLVFKPGRESGSSWYNLWRGFAVEPKEGEHHALSMFLDHAKQNVCQGNEDLFRWLIGYFAHLVQKPYEKPRTGLVFQGSKGVGKNALADRVGALIDQHYVVTSQKEDLTGRFNAQMECCLMLVLNEVTWGGEKEADAMLKNLVDGSRKHRIERKGMDVYFAENILRPIIIGNEPWLVAASEDERRYAVFKVSDNRKGDIRFFEQMRLGMEKGGYSHLLNYLLKFDISNIEVNIAPQTEALQEQKRYSLAPLDQWWLDSLMDGTILGCEFEGNWPEKIKTTRFRDAFHSYRKTQNIGGRFSNETIGRWLRKLMPEVKTYPVHEGETQYRVYVVPTLKQCRDIWDQRMGFKTEWP